MGIMDFVRGIGEKTLYFPGAFTGLEFLEHFENYIEIFERLGIGFITLDKGMDSGIETFNAGYRREARKLAVKNFGEFKMNSVVKIIASSPEDYYMFKTVYPSFIREWDIEVEHASVSILDGMKLRGIKYVGKDMDREVVSYQDSCYLARRCNIISEPREVIGLLGGMIVEIKNNREDVLCCGAGGGVFQNNPSLAREASKIRCKGIPKEASKFVCSSSLCYANLKSSTDKSFEFSSFVLGKLRGLGV